MNTVKTAVLIAAITALFVFVGGAVAGKAGMLIAFGLAVAMNMMSYWFSDKIVLMTQGAREASPADQPQLFESVERLTARAGLPMPRIYIISGDDPNAFATGRDAEHAAIAVTGSITQLLTPAELEGVLAHELAHVKNHDILICAMVGTLAGAIGLLAQMARWTMMFGGYGGDSRDRDDNIIVTLLTIILAPIAAFVIQMAVSRSREFEADATGARISGKPLALAGALQKVEAYAQGRPMPVNPSFAHLYIINPLSGKGISGLFRSHPPTEERIARLQEIARRMTA